MLSPLAQLRARSIVSCSCMVLQSGSLIKRSPRTALQHDPSRATLLRGPQAGIGPMMAPGQVVAYAAASSSWSSSSQQLPNEDLQQQGHRLARDLSWRPNLSTWQDLLVLTSAGLLCGVLYLFTAPARLSLPYAAGIAVLYGCLIWLMRSLLLEWQYQAKARLFSELGDPDSIFAQLGGILVHGKASISPAMRAQLAAQLHTATASTPYTAKAPAATEAAASKAVKATAVRHTTQPADAAVPQVVAVHCYHGFGANLYSYAPVQAKLAEAFQGLVTSHDMPGFGLTERPTSTANYFLSFNAQLGDQVMVHEVRRLLRDAVTPGKHNTGSGESSDEFVGTAWASTAGSQQQKQKQQKGRLRAWQKASTLKAHPLQGQEVWEEEEGQESSQAFMDSRAAGLQRAASPVSVLHSLDSGLLSRNGSMASSSDHPFSFPSSSNTTSQTPEHEQQVVQQDGSTSAGNKDNSHTVLASAKVKKVLIGHSMGSICAALQALKQPDAIAALVLVSPAIVALPDASTPQYELQAMAPNQDLSAREFPAKLVDRLACNTGGITDTGDAGDSSPASKLAFKDRLAKVLKAVLQAGLLLATLAVLNIMRPIIIVLLRVLVRSRGFWLKGLQQAYYDPSQVTDQVVDAYRLPQLVQGWEAGMFMFLTARLVHTTEWKALGSHLAAGLWSASPSIEQQVAAEELGLAHRLALLARQHRTPILIIHGQYDKLVPCSNSRRLAAMLPGAELAVLKQCGHMPQEEWPQLFVQLVHDFMQRRAAGSEKGQLVTLTASDLTQN